VRKINGRVEEPLEGILQKYGSDVSGAGENKNEIAFSLFRSPESHFLSVRITGFEPARTKHQILKLRSA
jgi:hypothetical protein